MNVLNILDTWLGRYSSVGTATGYGLDGPGSNPGGEEVSRTRPDRPWGPPSFLYNGYRVFPGGKERPGRGVDHPPTSSAEVQERVELYLYSPLGRLWPVPGRPLLYWIRDVAALSDGGGRECLLYVYLNGTKDRNCRTIHRKHGAVITEPWSDADVAKHLLGFCKTFVTCFCVE